MAVREFYAVIEHNAVDGYSVYFPDIENCFTDAESLSGAVVNAHDVLVTMLSEFERDGDKIPTPSTVSQIKIPEKASLVHIRVNTDEYKENT